MAYVSLYRKHRPQSFAEVVGQDHVTRTLTTAIDEDRLHHAYLFTGPRGTGKTSTARILAKSLNCEHGPTAAPCNACAHCTGITAGTHVDVIEIDAASHGGVDDVRDLRDRVAFAPATARRKVYIVDECHMLSTAGWNAFLKTVEEPPGHVVFVFATTEPHKVLDTILSRTQRFDFKRVPADILGGHVERLADLEGLTLEAGAVDLVVRAGDGSVRDTLSVLDQVVAFTGRTVSVEGVAGVLGTVPDDLLAEAADAIATGDVRGVVTLVDRVADAGHDLRQFARDAVEHLRRLLLLQVAPDAGLVSATPERLAALLAQSARIGRIELLRAVDLLAEAQAQMRRGATRLPLELALLKAALPESSGDPAALAARMDRLERRTGVDPIAPVPATAASPATAPSAAPAAAAPPARPVEDSRPAPPRDAVPPPEPPPADDEGSPVPPPARTAPADEPVAAPPPRPTPPPRPASPPAAAPPATAQPASAPTEEMSEPAAPTRSPEPTKSPEPARSPEPAAPTTSSGAAAQSAADEAPPAGGDTAPGVDLDLLTRSWPAVMSAVKARKIRFHALLVMADPTAYDGRVLTLRFRAGYNLHAEQCGGAAGQDVIAAAIEEVLGVRPVLRCVVADGEDAPPAVGGDDVDVPDASAADVFEAEQAEAAGELPDDAEAHERAIATLTRDLGATVVEDEPGA